jgi:Histidine-specific methyltransferase, SAM-dependent
MTRRKSSLYTANARFQFSAGSISKNIIDIRGEKSEVSLAEQIRSGLKDGRSTGRSLPSMLLWSEKGLKLFEAVSRLDDYYVARTEIDIFERHAADMAEKVKSHSMLVELGSGYVLLIPKIYATAGNFSGHPYMNPSTTTQADMESPRCPETPQRSSIFSERSMTSAEASITSP